jgi:hypothetical protein
MKCNCIKDTETHLKERVMADDFADQRPKNGTLQSILCQNLALAFSSGDWKLMIPFNSVWDVKGKRKEKPVNVAANYCPFCGISLTDKKP